MNQIKNKEKLCNSNHFDTSNPVAKRNTLYATIFTFCDNDSRNSWGILL